MKVSLLFLLVNVQTLVGWGTHRTISRQYLTQVQSPPQGTQLRASSETPSEQCGEACAPETCAGNKDSSSFLLNLEAPVSLEELADSNIVKIVNLECSDTQCNQLAWKCLGYTYDTAEARFKLSDKVFPKWASKYPVPPDVIGVTRTYSDPAVDRPVRDANMDLMRSVPRDFKGGVKSLAAVGFKLYKLNELTPNKTRRAQLATWLIFYRERLFGRTIEQLQAEAAERKRAAATVAGADAEAGELSPSEMMYERKRLDAPAVEHD